MDYTGTLLQPRAQASQAGSHRDGANSISGLVATLAPIFIVSLIVLLAFLFLSRKLYRIYAPRTYLQALDEERRSPKQSPGFLGWTKEYRDLADEFALAHSSMDNYLFLRLFKIMCGIALAGCIITWPILFPVNATGGGPESGLNLLSFSNVTHPARFYAHTFVAWVFLGLVMFVISRETLYYIYVRQAYLLSPFMTSRISSRTVLLTDVPEAYRNEEILREMFADVRTVWFGHDVDDLRDDMDDRDKALDKLEKAESKMIQDYVKSRNKQAKKSAKGKGDEESHPQVNGHSAPPVIDAKDRPTHRLPIMRILPLGKKVDTIDWSRNELHRLDPKVSHQQEETLTGKTSRNGAVFIEFETVRAAQSALQKTAHHNPLQMSSREIGMTPDQVLWDNIALPWWNIKLKSMIFTAIVTVLCIFWSAPVAFIGFITNIQALTDALPFLSFINTIPDPVIGVVTGLLPVLLLTILMKLVPIFCNIFAKTFEPTLGAVQLKVQSWYFAFQVIQVFLITTFASGASAVVQKIINDPTSAPQLLARNLPKASNFYISYFIIFGLLTMALQLLNVVPLLFVLILGKILDKTPRKMYNRYVSLSGLGWGSLYPKFTNLGVIAISYSCIAPLVLGFATLCFLFLYLAFRYNVLFTLGTTVDTKGRCYAKALQQLTVGIYLSEICLIGLFAINTGSSAMSAGPLVLMIVFLIGTVLWHLELRKTMHKLTVTLPEELLVQERQHDDHETSKEKDAEEGHASGHINGNVEKGDGYESSDSTKNTMNYTLRHPLGSSKPPPQPPTGFIGRIDSFFAPWTYASPGAISEHILSPTLAHPVRPYTAREREEAYLRPCIVSRNPVVWIPRDPYGLAEQEVQGTRDVLGKESGIEVSCKGAWVDEEGKLGWKEEELEKVPVWEERVVY